MHCFTTLVTRSMVTPILTSFFCLFNDTATTEIYTLSLHDALPICVNVVDCAWYSSKALLNISSIVISLLTSGPCFNFSTNLRSEEHTSELQSRLHLVCRLLLEKKKIKKKKKKQKKMSMFNPEGEDT